MKSSQSKDADWKDEYHFVGYPSKLNIQEQDLIISGARF